jgi:hypothetical protein
MSKTKYIIYSLSGIIVALTISLILVSINYKQQNVYLERVIFVNELSNRLENMYHLTLLLEELPKNENSMGLISEIYKNRGVNFTHKIRNYNESSYTQFLLNFDSDFNTIANSLARNVSLLEVNQLNDIINDLILVRGKMQNSIKWGHGGGPRGEFIILEFTQEDMHAVLENLRNIRGKLDKL